MVHSLSRRAALIGALASVPVGRAAAAEDRLAQLERENGGRLGVAAVDTATGRRLVHRADERFALCSTFKVLAAALVLQRVDRGEEQLDRRVVFGERDLVTYSPATKDRVGVPGMTLAELCEAGITLSDNTAGNLLLASFGGPAALTAFARAQGDPVTRLDRIETDLNEARTGDPRDTTTPAAMAAHLQRLVLGDALSAQGRGRLSGWLLANKTGAKRLRAGVPAQWRVGDKTGTGSNGSANDVGVFWPPDGGPIVTAVYFAEADLPDDRRSAVIAEVGRIVAASWRS